VANRHFSPHNGFQLVVCRRLPPQFIFRIATGLKGTRKYKCWTSGSPTDIVPTRRSTPLLQHANHCSANLQGPRQTSNCTGRKKGGGGGGGGMHACGLGACSFLVMGLAPMPEVLPRVRIVRPYAHYTTPNRQHGRLLLARPNLTGDPTPTHTHNTHTHTQYKHTHTQSTHTQSTHAKHTHTQSTHTKHTHKVHTHKAHTHKAQPVCLSASACLSSPPVRLSVRPSVRRSVRPSELL
jgi:hypothetical protein